MQLLTISDLLHVFLPKTRKMIECHQKKKKKNEQQECCINQSSNQYMDVRPYIFKILGLNRLWYSSSTTIVERVCMWM